MTYLTEVLGLKSLIKPRDLQTNVQAGQTLPMEPAAKPQANRLETTAKPLLFISSDDGTEVRELLVKITNALKLPDEKFEARFGVGESEIQECIDSGTRSAIVVFGDTAKPIEQKGETEVLQTHSLQNLINEPNLKKSTWLGLQEILKRAVLLFALFFSIQSQADCTTGLTVDGVIGPGTLDYIMRGLEQSDKFGCQSVLVRINTPGGNLQSTRLIVEKILNSKKPFLCIVAPAGAHAGSAGAIILQACHVAGAVATTNIGAATPVEGGGADIGKDLRQKLLNDTISWVEGLAELRGRNKKFAKDIVETAKVVGANEALSIGAIDFVGADAETFLKFSNGRDTKINGEPHKIKTGDLKPFAPDLRYRFLELVTHPQIAYLLFMISIGLLYFELTHPGMFLPGVAGVLGLVISLISFHMLDVQWGGLALLVLGIVFLVAEIFVPSFGALGVGGIISFVMGSLLLFDTAVGPLPLSMVLPTAILLGALMMGLGYLAMRTRSVKKSGGFDDIVGREGRVSSIGADAKNGMVEVHGEIWKFESDSEVKVGDVVQVNGVKHFVLKVQKKVGA
jgi:membrane-bound serine protease (ClpP class)